MLKRILTGIIGTVIFFAIVLTHQYTLYAGVTIVTLCMLYEVYKAMETEKAMRMVGYIVSLTMIFGVISGRVNFSLTAAMVILYLAVLFERKGANSKEILSTGFLTIIITFFMAMLFYMRNVFGRYTVILPFVCAWMSDTGAYFTGLLFGKHKLAKEISPKKTVEGAIGGVIFALLGAIAYIEILVFMKHLTMPPTWVIKFGIIGFCGGIISQFGDLIASCIKRDYNKKDYGTILPGHGGFMDRFDSVIIVIPFVYYAMKYLIF